ncbi:hypothetical protein [Methylobacterium thuringiense]|uniref:Uncharacterized protein n=1 Tax=Methylobacterium thuringiense TaxID=1003091 RepID=A0ABQ4TQF5_9HYPH|nr:hypothetical protein [Methylobacterium thuringiense]GJE56897.1 hypothetical protein EKPJFOCH_3407 [Methylobacterium thuringiense]
MNDHTTPDTRSSDLLVGDLFRRLYLMRDLSEVTFRAAIEGALVALGRAALEEAEARGRRVAERTGARPTDVRVTPWGQRRPTEGADLPEG